MFSSNHVLDSLSIQLAVLDADGIVIAVNQAWMNLAFSSQSSPLTRIDIGDAFLDVFRVARDPLSLDNLKAVIQGSAAEFNFEYQWDHYWYLLRAVPIKSPDGGAVLTHIDISDIKQAQAQLRESEERYRSVFEGSPHPMWVYDTYSLMFLDVNDAAVELYGYSRNEFLNMTILEIRPPQDVPKVLDSISRRQQEPSVKGRLWKHRKKDGSLIDVEVSAHLIQLGGRECEVVLVNDITARKQAEAQQLELLLAQERINTLTDFIQSFSHDFRTPLSTIKTTLYLMNKEGRTADYRLQNLEEQVTHLERLVDGFRLMARLDSQTQVSTMPLDIQAVMQHVIDQMRELVNFKRLRLTLNLMSNVGIYGDEQDLESALSNLVENAVLYTPEGGEVTIRVYQQEAHLVIDVQDTGIGIQAADLPHIFQRFFRADKARSLSGHPGLGLPIARKIIELHGGDIQVESTPGHGSLFRVILPVTQ